ncbi:hypothetical protein L596_029827 [Steinernema carpocapsae]|uniref:DDE Tnp4 domain-containing protein n=1 Tax=Steinernema carpocapsae TaxID=34508 RepID=A0A4U5LQX0_STECR|nr:hypothetical protein L596_029816 [Steinernema carpocapsae]TKR58374.1 hypothetical protein L596_029827 [Steinernema carpocapsae]
MKPQAPKRLLIRMEEFFFDAALFRERFRLTQSQTEELLRIIGPAIAPDSSRNFAMTAKQKLLAALRFYASGSYYYNEGDAQRISKSSVCRAIKLVTKEINIRLFPRIDWPTNPCEAGAGFADVAGIQGVCGAIDGTLVPIKTPSAKEYQFVDRKQRHSLNVMAVCGPNLSFYYVSAKRPESVNDRRILRTSTLGRRFEAGFRPFENAVLLGDSIYPTKNWLIPMKSSPPSTQTAFYKLTRKHDRSLSEHLECSRVVSAVFLVCESTHLNTRQKSSRRVSLFITSTSKRATQSTTRNSWAPAKKLKPKRNPNAKKIKSKTTKK